MILRYHNLFLNRDILWRIFYFVSHVITYTFSCLGPCLLLIFQSILVKRLRNMIVVRGNYLLNFLCNFGFLVDRSLACLRNPVGLVINFLFLWAIIMRNFPFIVLRLKLDIILILKISSKFRFRRLSSLMHFRKESFWVLKLFICAFAPIFHLCSIKLLFIFII